MKTSIAKPSFDGVTAAYDRRIGRWSRLYIPSLLSAARIRAGDTVLDIATGTGEVVRSARRQIGPAGTVIGCDISVPMLRAAQSQLDGEPLAAMDATALACREGSVDAVTCQLGLMFFPDPARALTEFHRILRDGGWMAACVWSSEERAPFVSIFPDVMGDYVSVSREVLADGTSLGDEQRLRDLVSRAGFRDIHITVEVQEFKFSDFEEYWEPIEAGGSTTAELYVSLSVPIRHEVKERVRMRMLPYFSGERLIIETEALLVSGRKWRLIPRRL